MSETSRPHDSWRLPDRAGLLALLTVAGLSLAACRADEPTTTTQPIPLVAAQPVVEQSWAEVIELSAELAPRAVVTLAAEIPGKIVALPVDHGDRVAAGDLVAHLDATSARAELAQAKARLESAEASRDQALRDHRRAQTLATAGGVISDDDLERRKLSLATGEAAVREAEAAGAVAEEKLADTEIRAPFAGVISTRSVELGSWVSPGTAIVRIVDQQRLKAHAAASQADRVRLRLEAPVEVRTEALPGAVFAGKIRFLGQEADPETGTYLVEAEVPVSATTAAGLAHERLLPGMHGSMSITLATRTGIVIPRTALLATRQGEAVFVVADGVGQRRAVEIVPIDPSRVQVVAGLTAGDLLVVQGQHLLADGDAVEVRTP